MSWPLLALVWTTTALRLIFVRSTVAELRMNAALVFASLALALRRSWVREFVESWLGGGVARPLGNIFIMLTAASLISMFCAWAVGPERLPGIHAATIAAALVVGVGQIALSAPARSQGRSIDEVGGWPFAVYSITYAIPVFSASALIGWISIRNIRGAAAGRERRIFLTVIALALFEALDMTFVAAAGVVNVVSGGNAFTETRSESGQFVRLLVISAGALIASAPATRVIADRYRSYRMARQIQPMWQTLTEAVPEVVLELRPGDRRTLSSCDRLDRMIVEIHDAILILDRHVILGIGDRAGATPTLAAAAGLHLACRARTARHPAHATAGVHPSPAGSGAAHWDLVGLAERWREAEEIAATLWARRLPQFGGIEHMSRVTVEV